MASSTPDRREDEIGGTAVRGPAIRSPSDGEDTQRLCGQRVVVGANARAIHVRKRHRVRTVLPARAEIEHSTRATLDEENAASFAVLMKGRHEPRRGIEGNLTTARPGRTKRGGIEPRLERGHEQRRFRRITVEDQPSLARSGVRVVDQHPRREEPLKVGVGGDVHGLSGLADDPDRGASAAGDVEAPSIQHETRHRHLVLRHGARLVRADHRGRPKRLHGGEPPHQGAVAGEAPEACGQRDRGDGRQTLRDRRDGETDGGLEHEADRLSMENADDAHYCADAEGQGHQASTQSLHLGLERRGAPLGEGHELANASELGSEPGGRDESGARPREHAGAEIHHGGSHRQRSVDSESGVRILGHGKALAREGGLVHAQSRGCHQPRVGGHVNARLERDEIAGNEIGARHGEGSALAPYASLRHRQRAQPIEGAARAPFRGGADRCIEDEGGQDRYGVRTLTEPPGDRRSGEQEQDH